MVELLIVVAIIAIISTSAIAGLSFHEDIAVKSNADRLVRALEFAHQEALRTGSPKIVAINVTTNMVSVEDVYLGVVPPARSLLTHPLTRRPYQVQLDQTVLLGTSISLRAAFAFADGTTSTEIAFDKQGTPGKIASTSTFVSMITPGYWRGPWQGAAMSYKSGDWVVSGGEKYDCISNHNSRPSFPAELASGLWTKRTSPAQIAISGNRLKHEIDVLPVTGFTLSRAL